MRSRIDLIEHRFEAKVEQGLARNLLIFLDEHPIKINNSDSFLHKEVQKKLIEDYCHENEHWFDEIPFSVYLEEGAEQKVFYEQPSNQVVKINDAIFYVNWSQYMESIVVHNLLFPLTKYEVRGFLKINEILYCVVSQPYIVPTEQTDLSKVRNYMLNKGFDIKKNNDYKHSSYGLIIEDLHEENVLVSNDELFFIDTVIYLV